MRHCVTTPPLPPLLPRNYSAKLHRHCTTSLR
jgi:hypothetical protein